MALLQFGDLSFDASLVAFDKDGTLIDFDALWGRPDDTWVQRLTPGVGDEALRHELFRSLGYDVLSGRTLAGSPLAIASTQQLLAIVSSVLYRHGIPWTEAADRTRAAFHTGEIGRLANLIKPAGDVRGLLGRLQEADVRVAVVTTDNRHETEEALRILGVEHLVDFTMCGDDRVCPKPEPDMLLAVCHHLALPPARCVVVGDTMGDLLMAERAGAGLSVGVLSGVGDPLRLESKADVVLPSIDDIAVVELVPRPCLKAVKPDAGGTGILLEAAL